MRKASVGDVLVTDAACQNPYTYAGPWRTGEQRRLALAIFRDGGFTEGMTLWHAPAGGGARRITADEVAW